MPPLAKSRGTVPAPRQKLGYFSNFFLACIMYKKLYLAPCIPVTCTMGKYTQDNRLFGILTQDNRLCNERAVCATAFASTADAAQNSETLAFSARALLQLLQLLVVSRFTYIRFILQHRIQFKILADNFLLLFQNVQFTAALSTQMPSGYPRVTSV